MFFTEVSMCRVASNFCLTHVQLVLYSIFILFFFSYAKPLNTKALSNHGDIIHSASWRRNRTYWPAIIVVGDPHNCICALDVHGKMLCRPEVLWCRGLRSFEHSLPACRCRSAQSQRTIGSTTSAGSSLSRIPIKRNSSMRRNKHIMENYKTNSGEEDDDDVDDEDFDHREEGNRDAKRNSHPRRQLSNRQRSPAALRRRQQQQPKVPKDPSSRSLERGQTSRRVSGRTGGISLSKSIGALNGVDRDATVAAPSDNPFQTSSMVKNSPVMPRRSQKPRTAQKDELREDGDQGESDRHTMDDGTKIESVTSGLSSASGEENIPPNSTSSQSNEIPPEPPSSAPPPKEESQVPVAPRAQTVAGDASRLSTANSTVSTGSYLVSNLA